MALRARSAPCSRRQRLQLRRQCARGRGQQRKRRQRNRLPTGSRAHSFSCIVFMFAYLACSTQSSCFHLFHFQSHIFIFPNFLFQIRSKSINRELKLGNAPLGNETPIGPKRWRANGYSRSLLGGQISSDHAGKLRCGFDMDWRSTQPLGRT